MVIRTYFDKNNTIIKDSKTNTGKNPITELYYGTSNNRHVYSRYLFHFSLDDIQKHFSGVSNVKHILKMTNTGVFHNDLLNTTTGDGKKRTSAFKLSIFRINESWAEGTGYDHSNGLGSGNTHSESASNFFRADATKKWSDEYLIHIKDTPVFDAGNENLEVDITDIVNNMLNNIHPNHGLALAFHSELEQNTSIEGLHYVGFFSRHTQTFYQPFIETRTTEPINDGRNKFYMGRENKLYFYNTQNGVLNNVSGTIKVDIQDSNGNTIMVDMTPTNERKGIYSIKLMVPFSEDTIETTMHDVWKIDGKPVVENYFILQDDPGRIQMGGYSLPGVDYRIDIRGIKHNERIKRGDIRKIYVNPVIPYTVNNQTSIDKLEYRLYVKEGDIEHTVIDFEAVDRTALHNFFLLDTMSLLPNTYYLDIKGYSNYEVKNSPGIIKFEIV